MKILHVLVAFHPSSSAGGPVSNVYAYAQGLLHRGHHVSVCCSDRLGLTTEVQVDTWSHGVSAPVIWDGIAVTYVKSFRLGLDSNGAMFSPGLWWHMNQEVERFDAIHIHGAWNTFNVMASFVARLHHVPYVIQLHNTFAIRLRRIMLKKMVHVLVRGAWFDNAAAILTLTPDEKKEYLLSRPQDREKVFVVPSVMPTVRTPDRGVFRRKWGISKDDCLVLYLGRLHEGKGVEYLIRSMQLIAGDGVRFVIVGPDAGRKATLEETVERLRLADRVVFTGPIYGDERFCVYSDADVFVLPSMFEQLPVSALEAALCGVPLVLSDQCGMTQMVTEADAGLIVPYGQPQPLADAIETLCSNPDQRRRMGRNARSMVARYCDSETIINRLEDVYRKACS